jgi:hypothetical protein
MNALMSLLSHDNYEIEYEFADATNMGIKTKSNVLRRCYDICTGIGLYALSKVSGD